MIKLKEANVNDLILVIKGKHKGKVFSVASIIYEGNSRCGVSNLYGVVAYDKKDYFVLDDNVYIDISGNVEIGDYVLDLDSLNSGFVESFITDRVIRTKETTCPREIYLDGRVVVMKKKHNLKTKNKKHDKISKNDEMMWGWGRKYIDIISDNCNAKKTTLILDSNDIFGFKHAKASDSEVLKTLAVSTYNTFYKNEFDFSSKSEFIGFINVKQAKKLRKALDEYINFMEEDNEK